MDLNQTHEQQMENLKSHLGKNIIPGSKIIPAQRVSVDFNWTEVPDHLSKKEYELRRESDFYVTHQAVVEIEGLKLELTKFSNGLTTTTPIGP